jgi:CDGSH-type Zn-finger protein
MNITVLKDGPIMIEGDMHLMDAAGAAYGLSGRAKIALCRCGQSAKKPFCDGAHRTCGFKSEVKAETLPPPKA